MGDNMNLNWLRPGRRLRLALVLVACVGIVGIVIPLTARAFPVLFDGQLYYTGGDVTVDVLHYDSVYDDVLQLRTSLGSFDLAKGSHIGSKMTLTADQLADMGIGVGDELQFALHVRDTGNDFFLGSGDRNADGISHAYLRSAPGNKFYVGFEDLIGGGDRDYNDTVIRFSGGMSTTPTSLALHPASDARVAQVAEPSMLLLLIPAIGLLSLKRRTK